MPLGALSPILGAPYAPPIWETGRRGVVGLVWLLPKTLERRRSPAGDGGTLERLSMVRSDSDGRPLGFRMGDMSPPPEWAVLVEPSSEPSLLMLRV